MEEEADEPIDIIVTPTNLIPKGPKFRAPRDLRRQEWALLGIGALAILGGMGFGIHRFVSNFPPSFKSVNIDFALASLLVVNGAFCLYYLCSGIFRERRVELFALVISILVVLLYGTIDYAARPQKRNNLKLARLVLSWTLGPAVMLLAFFVQRSFGWLEFRRVGPSEVLQKIYRERSFFYSLTSLDLQAILSFFLLGLTSAENLPKLEVVLDEGLGIPISLIWSLLLYVAVLREKLWLVWPLGIFGLCFCALPVAMTALLFDAQGQRFLIIATMLSGALFLLVRAILLAELWRNARAFGQGLLLAMQEGARQPPPHHRF